MRRSVREEVVVEEVQALVQEELFTGQHLVINTIVDIREMTAKYRSEM